MYRVEIPGGAAGAEAVRDLLERWLATPALRALVEADGGTWMERGSLLERVEALHEFSDKWDFRGGGERLEIAHRTLSIADAEIMVRAGELGLTEPGTPVRAEYDHALVLGGTALACIHRMRRLRNLLDGGLRIRAVAALTGLRAIGDGERELVEQRPDIAVLVTGAPTEFDVMVGATAHWLGGNPQVERHEDPNPDRSFARATVGEVLVLAAPPAEPTRRANTFDNYAVYADRIEPGDEVLIITSSNYRPYQLFIALQALGWYRPLAIEMVGFPPEWMKGVLTGPENMLQELRSAIFGATSVARRLN